MHTKKYSQFMSFAKSLLFIDEIVYLKVA